MKNYKCLKVLLAVLITVLAICGTAAAETERGDLSNRFADTPVIEHLGQEYRLRNRLTTMLFLGTEQQEDGTTPAIIAILLVVDDDAKRISLLDIDTQILLPAQLPPHNSDAAEDAVPAQYSLGSIIAKYEQPQAGCEATVAAIDNLLPAPVIDHYIALNMAGLTLLDGKHTADYPERLRAIKNTYGDASTGELTKAFDSLKEYMETEMKSGALMRIADKAERYEVLPMIHITAQQPLPEGEQQPASADENIVVYSEETIKQLAIQIFFEEKPTKW